MTYTFQKILAFKFSFIFMVCLLFGCKTPQVNKDNKMDNTLINCWTHSYEEQTQDNSQIFRPCDYKEFPPSRYRRSFTLYNDKTCQDLVLSPTDGHYNEKGTWSFDADTKTLNFTSAKDLKSSFQVIDCQVDKLVLKTTSQQ